MSAAPIHYNQCAYCLNPLYDDGPCDNCDGTDRVTVNILTGTVSRDE